MARTLSVPDAEGRGRYRHCVLLLLVAIVVGGSVGLLRAPTGAHTTRPVVQRLWLVALGAVVYAAALLLDGGLATLVTAASLTALIAAASANRHLTGVVTRR